MITSKQRAILRSHANQLDTIVHIGKNGINQALIDQVNEALDSHELVKIKALETSLLSAKEAAAELAQAVKCDVVQVVGGRLVLFRPNKEKPYSQYI